MSDELEFNPLTVTDEQLASFENQEEHTVETEETVPVEETDSPDDDVGISEQDAVVQDSSAEEDSDDFSDVDLARMGITNDEIKQSLKNKHGKEKVKILKRALLNADKQRQAENELKEKINNELSEREAQIQALTQQIQAAKAQKSEVDSEDLLADIAVDPQKAINDIIQQNQNNKVIQGNEQQLMALRQQQANQQALNQSGINLTTEVVNELSEYLVKEGLETQANVNAFRAAPYGSSPSIIKAYYLAMQNAKAAEVSKVEKTKEADKASKVLDKALGSAKAGPSVTGSAPTAASSGDANIPLTDEALFNMSPEELDRLAAGIDSKSLHVGRSQIPSL